MSVFEWLPTGATYPGPGGEPRGWRLHAVMGATKEMTAGEAWKLPAACGLTPRPWGMDLFIEKKCARCLRALGIACAACRGKGSTGSTLDGSWEVCLGCFGTGEAT